MSIIQTTGVITKAIDLSPTAREYTITPSSPLSFCAGAFVNIFIENNGQVMRRAFSISSTDTENKSFTVSIRLNPKGLITPLLWEKDFTGQTIKIMGPLGLNTADKMHSSKTFLFGFGIGAGVVKSLADHISARPDTTALTIMTGNRSNQEIIYQDYFDELAKENNKVSVQYVVSDKEQTTNPVGYIQDHVSRYNFDEADVYMCGQGVACQALEAAVRATNPTNCHFFIEDFH